MLGYGGSVHSLVLKNGFGGNLVVENTLVRMYGACGRVEFARRVFDEMTERDVVSWSSMIAAYLTWYNFAKVPIFGYLFVYKLLIVQIMQQGSFGRVISVFRHEARKRRAEFCNFG